MGIEQTRYLVIIGKPNLSSAKNRFRQLIFNFPELGDDDTKQSAYDFVIGEKHTGHANGKEIKNNYIINDHGNQNWIFIFEWNTVVEFGDAIEAEVIKEGNEDLNWCKNTEVAPFFPFELDVI